MAPPAGPAPEICPNGHALAPEQVIIRNGHKVCPVCEQHSQAWLRPPQRPAFWRRQVLRIPLAVLAAAFLLGTISSAFGIATAASYVSHQLPGSGAQMVSSIFDTLSELAIAVGLGWAAYLVGLESEPGSATPRSTSSGLP
jgi:RsiW-degrading membrane proteinase PrsW (M82 family)